MEQAKSDAAFQLFDQHAGLPAGWRRVGRLADQRPSSGRAGPADRSSAGCFLMLDKAQCAASFAADVTAEKAEFMANSPVPWGVAALSGTVTEPAWKGKPSWYLVATDDRMIPAPAQRAMAKRANAAVAEVIKSAAKSLSQK